MNRTITFAALVVLAVVAVVIGSLMSVANAEEKQTVDLPPFTECRGLHVRDDLARSELLTLEKDFHAKGILIKWDNDAVGLMYNIFSEEGDIIGLTYNLYLPNGCKVRIVTLDPTMYLEVAESLKTRADIVAVEEIEHGGLNVTH